MKNGTSRLEQHVETYFADTHGRMLKFRIIKIIKAILHHTKESQAKSLIPKIIILLSHHFNRNDINH